MVDADGKAYVDYCMAYGAMLLGHANAEILDAVKAQLSKGTLYGAPTELEVQFAEANQQSFALHGNDAPRQHRHRSHNACHPSSKRLHWTQKNHQIRRLLPRLATTTSWLKPVQAQQLLVSPNSLGIPEETTQKHDRLALQRCRSAGNNLQE